MAIKHKPTKEVHKGTKGGKTGCGFNTREGTVKLRQSSTNMR